VIARIDAHQHFWRFSRGDYAWLRPELPALQPLCRDFLPDDLRPALHKHAIGQTVLVQAAATTAETEFLLELARAHAWIGGVVGWVDLSRRDAADTLRRWSGEPKFKSVRPMLQDLPDADWIARAPHPEAMQALLDGGLRFDALVNTSHLQPLLQFVARHPNLPVVIDHAAKPRLEAGWAPDKATAWRHGIAAVAEHPHVMCKLSGLLTEIAGPQATTVAAAIDAVRPVWEHLLHCFGPQRLMWGSDWPVLNLAADIDRWVAVCEALIGDLPAADQTRVWHDNACRFYALPPLPHAEASAS
jgi:L-fuconolactonase